MATAAASWSINSDSHKSPTIHPCPQFDFAESVQRATALDDAEIYSLEEDLDTLTPMQKTDITVQKSFSKSLSQPNHHHSQKKYAAKDPKRAPTGDSLLSHPNPKKEKCQPQRRATIQSVGHIPRPTVTAEIMQLAAADFTDLNTEQLPMSMVPTLGRSCIFKLSDKSSRLRRTQRPTQWMSCYPKGGV
jgi:hypothetical protein